MPTYEYLCKKCSHRFEQWQRMIDEPLEICPECGGTVRRVYYPAGIVFKGSGFYKTDHNGSSSTVSSNEHTSKSENDGATAKPEAGTSTEKKPVSTESSSSSPKSESKVTAPATN